MGVAVKNLFTPKDVARLTGLSYRQIQYWDSSGFIRPSYRRRGRYRCYTFGDLVLLEVARRQREAGLSVQRLRRLVAALAPLVSQAPPDQLENYTFFLEGERVLLFYTGEMLMSGGIPPGAFRFRVQELREQVDALFPEAPDEGPEGRLRVG